MTTFTSTTTTRRNTATSKPTTPSMTIDATHIPSKLLLQLTTTNIPPKPSSRPSTPTSHTAPLTTFTTRPRSCYLCDEQNPGDFSPTITHLETCALCTRPFCPIHRTLVSVHHNSNSTAPVCSINHSRYYHVRLARARVEVANDESEAEDMLARAGVFPSMGERERAIWRAGMSPKRGSGGQAEEALRNSSERITARRASTPVETKELVGADIAV